MVLQGLVVQIIIRLTKLLVKKLDLLSFLVHTDTAIVLIFFAKRLDVAFALQKLSTDVLAKNSHVFAYNMFEKLTSH